jgi:hypothetical protein
MTMRSAPRRRTLQQLGAPAPLEHAGNILHAAGDKRQYSQTNQQEKQKHPSRIGQGKQQRSHQDSEY